MRWMSGSRLRFESPSRLGPALGFLLVVLPVVADEDSPDPEGLRPGLIARDRSASGPGGPLGPALARVAGDVVEHWGAGSPDPRLSGPSFSTTRDGWLLIREPGPYRFRLSADGEARMLLDGRPVLEGQGGAIRSGPIDLRPGLTRLHLVSEHDRGEAHLVLDWEGPGFGIEHVPSHLLFHEAADSPPIDRFEQGRQLADRLGCASCHPVLNMPGHPRLGPPLDASTSIRPGWLEAWLRDPSTLRPGTPMPGFGLDRAQAADLAAFLASVSGPRPRPDLEGQMAINVADPERGRLLFRSAGCLACHPSGKDDDAGSSVGPAPDLSDLRLKRTLEGVSNDLGGSGRNDPGRHRPALGLTTDSAAHLAAYLTSMSGDGRDVEDFQPIPGDADRGRTLAESIGCVSCHEIPGLRSGPKFPALSHRSDPTSGCLADEPSPGTPRFGLDDEDRQRLRSFVAGLPEWPAPLPESTLAADHLRRRNCLGCHSRDGSGGEVLGSRLASLLAEDRELNTLKGTLTPPDLSSVGAKLRPEYLDLAFRGGAPVARPWLSMRMPRYDFEPGEAERIASEFSMHDRVEDAPRPDHASPTLGKGKDLGISLLGRDGFGCVSCHVVSGRIPPGGEAETLGPDLALAHRRMTRAYYDRWLKDPQRIIPGTPMPQFLLPAPGVGGPVDEQLGAIWEALGDDRLAELTSTATRQVLDRPGDRDLVVRDMIVPDDTPSEHYPRGLVIGLRNGFSMLFDSDRLGWIRWWDGGFLSRTKQGRLWEWHPEGRPLWVADQPLPPIVFEDTRGQLSPPLEDRERFGSFSELRFEPDGVRLRYRLNGPGGETVDVIERIEPRPDGWERLVRVVGVPEGFRPLLVAGTGALASGSTPGIARIDGSTIRLRAGLDQPFLGRGIGDPGAESLLIPGSPTEESGWDFALGVSLTPEP
jgi:mono/diheme cytochrome c family protein